MAWDALFANQRQAYYDIYALRHPLWCPSDCWQEVARATTFPFRNKKLTAATRTFVYDRQFQISPFTPPISVYSAFGGLAIYRREALRHCWYGSRDRLGRRICEHVVLHQQMLSNGANLFIAPTLLNDAPAEHLGATSGQPFPYELCSSSGNLASSGVEYEYV